MNSASKIAGITNQYRPIRNQCVGCVPVESIKNPFMLNRTILSVSIQLSLDITSL